MTSSTLLVLAASAFAQSGLELSTSLLGSLGDYERRSERAEAAREAGEAAMARDDFEEALARYQEAADNGTFMLGTEQCGIAQAAEALGKTELALEAWDACDAHSLVGSAIGYGGLGGYGEEPVDHAAVRRSRLPELIRLRMEGRQALAEGRHADALAVLVEAYDLDSHCMSYRCAPWTLRATARAATGTGDFDRARRFYGRYLELRPEGWDRAAIDAELVALSDAEAAWHAARVDGAVRLEQRWAAPPDWLLPEHEDAHLFQQQDSVRAFAIGRYSGSGAWYGLDAEGLVGPLAIPTDAAWVSLSEAGVVYVQAPDGQLSRAPSLREATETGAFAALGSFPDTTWDTAGETIVGLREDEVVVSFDAGASFERRVVDARQALARADGVAVVVGRPDRLLVRRVGGTDWEITEGLGVEQLVRVGSFIGFERVEEMSYTGSIYDGPTYDWVCAEGVLADDGATWVAFGDGPGGDDGGDRPMDLFSAPSTSRWDRDLSPPAPSADGETAQDAIARCLEDPDAYHGGRYGVGGLAGGGLPPFDIRRLPLVRTAVQHDFIGDADCWGERCKPRERGTLLRLEPDVVTPVPLHRSCNPRQRYELGGPVAVECWGGELLLLDTTGEVAERIELDAGATQATVGPDGTMLLLSWDSAWVRRPVPLGTPDAWRNVVIDGARAYRPAPGGAVLALASDLPEYNRREDHHSLSVWLDDGEPVPLAEGLAFPKGTIVDLHVRDDGALELEVDHWEGDLRCLLPLEGTELDCHPEG